MAFPLYGARPPEQSIHGSILLAREDELRGAVAFSVTNVPQTEAKNKRILASHSSIFPWRLASPQKACPGRMSLLTALLHGHFLLMPAHEILTKGCGGSILPHPTSTAGGSIRRHRHTSGRVHRWWLIAKDLTHNWVTAGAVFGQLGFEKGWSGLCLMSWRTPMQWHPMSQSRQLQSSQNLHFSELDVQKGR